jgi:MFS family permease
MNEAQQKFQGYKAAVACFVIMFASYGSLSTFAIFLPEFIVSMNSDVATIGYMASFFGFGGVIGNAVAGKVFEVIPLKWCAVIGNLMIATHYTMYSFAENVTTLYIAAAIAGLGMGIGTLSCCAAIIQQWFIDYREKLIGLSFAGAGFGAGVWMFLDGQMIELIGYRHAYHVMIAFVLLVCIPLTIILIKDPKKIGQKPLGWEKEEELKSLANSQEDVGISFVEAVKKPVFYIMLIGVTFIGMLILGFETYAPEYWQQHGVGVAMSATYLTIYYLIGCGMTMVSGVIAQKISVKAYIIYTNIFFIIGAICVAAWPSFQTFGFTLLILFCMGVAYPLFSSVPATVTTITFGNRDYAKICAVLTAGFMMGSVLYPIGVGFCVNYFGTLVAAYYFLAISAAVAMILIVIGLYLSPMKKLLNRLQQTS